MRKIATFFLSIVVFAQVLTSFSATASASATSPSIDNAHESVNERTMTDEEMKAELQKIIKSQLDAQNAPQETYAYFDTYVEETFSRIKNGTFDVQNTKASDSTHYITMNKGGEVFFRTYWGNLTVSSSSTQYVDPTVTHGIIDKYKTNQLPTWQSLAIFVLSYRLAKAHPVLDKIIFAVGGLTALGKWMDAENVKAIERGTGASKYIHVTSSNVDTVVWVPWSEYPYATVQYNDTTKDQSWTVY